MDPTLTILLFIGGLLIIANSIIIHKKITNRVHREQAKIVSIYSSIKNNSVDGQYNYFVVFELDDLTKVKFKINEKCYKKWKKDDEGILVYQLKFLITFTKYSDDENFSLEN